MALNDHLPVDSYDFKAVGVDCAYAQACRERCKPDECNLSPECWVAHGTAASLGGDKSPKAPRCAACNGRVKWLFPPVRSRYAR